MRPGITPVMRVPWPEGHRTSLNLHRGRKLVIAGILFSLLIIAAPSQIESAGVQRSGVSEAGQKKYRLIRSISGPKGHEEGPRFVIDDPRTVFRIPTDTQVIVYLEWEGPPGRHAIEGLWKNPADKVVVVSDFTLEVRQNRFAGYFTLLLAETTETGIWTLEARVDGETTGSHKFQIVSAKDAAALPEPAPTQPQPSGPPPEQARQPLTESKIYELANLATVLIEKYDAKGVRIDSGSGFFVDSDVILTAFQVIDGGSKLRLSLSDGHRLETDQALTCDKWQDWAFLKVSSGQQRLIKFSSDAESSIGSRVYTLAVSPDGARVLVRCDVVGKNKSQQNGERISLNCSHPNVTGSPLMNEYGDLIGVVGGNLIPGWGSTKSITGVYYGGAQLGNSTPGLLAVPVSASSKPSSTHAPTSLQQLATDGTFITPVSGFENILFGTLAKRIETNPRPRTVDETYDFRSKEGSLVIFVSWQPKEKIKAAATIRVYDLSGRVLIESKPSKLNLKPRTPADSWWKADISSLKPATYRVDVFLDSNPVWRAFFKVRD